MRLAVIGCGFQGRLHLEHLTAFDQVEVAAVCDIDPQRLDQVSSLFGIRNTFTDYRALLESEEFDLVTVCTMPQHHMSMTIDALSSGANVLCEKPMAMSVEQGAAMLKEARRTNRMLSIGFNMRHMASAQSLKRYVDQGKLGRAIYTHAWAKASQIPWWGEHYHKEKSGGGALASTAVHLLDLAMWLADSFNPTTVTASSAKVFPLRRGGTAPSPQAAASYDVEDLISGHIRFADGFWMAIEGSWVDNVASIDGVPSWDYSLDAWGEKAQLNLDPLQVTIEDEDGNILSDLPPDAPSGTSFSASTGRMLADVIAAIRNGREPTVRAVEALAVQATVDAMYRSVELEREVPVNLPRSALTTHPSSE